MGARPGHPDEEEAPLLAHVLVPQVIIVGARP